MFKFNITDTESGDTLNCVISANHGGFSINNGTDIVMLSREQLVKLNQAITKGLSQ